MTTESVKPAENAKTPASETHVEKTKADAEAANAPQPKSAHSKPANLETARSDVFTAKKELQTLIAKNKEAIARLRALFDEVKTERAARDAENAQVQTLKKERLEAEQKVEAARTELDALYKTLSALPDVENPKMLKDQIEKLEWIQQTDSNVTQERQLSKEIKDLRGKLPKAQAKSESFTRRTALRDALRKVSAQARDAREKLRKHAKASDTHHTAMIKALEKAKSLREKLSEAFKDLDQKRALLDTEQKEFHALQTELRSQEKSEFEKERAEKAAALASQKKKVSAKAQEAWDKFKSGKKISMDELLAIQEAGLG